MDFQTNKGEYYSFSPDSILLDDKKNIYNFIDEKKIKIKLNLLYKSLGNFDIYLNNKNFSTGLKRSIINEIFINSSVFYIVELFSNRKFKNNVIKINSTNTNEYVLKYLKKYVTKNIFLKEVKNKNKYNKLQILKQINFKEIIYYLKKKYLSKKNRIFKSVIYKECPLLINDQLFDFKETFFIRDEIPFNKFKILNRNNNKIYSTINSFKIFNPFYKSFTDNKTVKEIIENIIQNTINNYFYIYSKYKKFLNNYQFDKDLKFYTSQLSNTADFALMDIFKIKYNSEIIVYQHGHGQGLGKYQNSIKFLKESSYSDKNIVFSNNAKEYDIKNNLHSISKTEVSKYYQPYNKFFSKINNFKKNYDLIYFSPFHMNGTNRSLYNYSINDLNKIKIERKIIEEILSVQNMNILIKKYPYDYQKYFSEIYIKNLTSRYKNLKYYDKTLKYPEFYKKNQIILTVGCTSTLGYLAAFENPIILINLHNYFPLNESIKKKLENSIFLFDYNDKNFFNKINRLLNNKNYLLKQWELKEKLRTKFYKNYLGIK